MADRIAIVWGAAGGIGRATVEALVGRGFDVHGVARDASRLVGVVADPSRAHAADVGDPAAVRAAADEIGRVSPPAAIWVYAVGDIMASKVASMSDGDWQRIIGANLSGAFFAAHASLPYLAPDAHLLFLGAPSERVVVPGLAAYASAKAGLESFVAVLAKDERGHKVTLVRPMAVRTPLWNKVPFKPPSTAIEPAEVARAIVQAYDQGRTGVLDL